MTIVPVPVQKPLRRLEIVTGVICVGVGVWMLVLCGSWLVAAAPAGEHHTVWESALLLVKAVYLLGFGGALLRTGYVAVLFWVIAAAVLISFPVTAGLVS